MDRVAESGEALKYPTVLHWFGYMYQFHNGKVAYHVPTTCMLQVISFFISVLPGLMWGISAGAFLSLVL